MVRSKLQQTANGVHEPSISIVASTIFCPYVPHRISIQHIPTNKQPVDILTKAVDQSTLHRH